MKRIVDMLGAAPAPQTGDGAPAQDAHTRHQERLIALAAMVADLIAVDEAASAPAPPQELTVESWSLWKDAAGGIVLRVDVADGLALSLQLGETSARSLFDALALEEAQAPEHERPAPHH